MDVCSNYLPSTSQATRIPYLHYVLPVSSLDNDDGDVLKLFASLVDNIRAERKATTSLRALCSSCSQVSNTRAQGYFLSRSRARVALSYAIVPNSYRD